MEVRSKKSRSITGHAALLVVLLVLVALTMLPSCSKKKQYVIGVSLTHKYPNSWREKLVKELEFAGIMRDDVTLSVLSADARSSYQVSQIEAFINQKVDLLIVSPTPSSDVVDAITRAYESGIPVILVDGYYLTDKFTAFLGTDDENYSNYIASYINHLLGGHGKVLEITGERWTSGTEILCDMQKTAMERYPGLDFHTTKNGSWSSDICFDAFMDFVTENGVPDLVYMHSFKMYNSSFRKYTTAEDHPMKIVCTDVLPVFYDMLDTSVERIRQRDITAVFEYPTRGDKVFTLAMDILEGLPYNRVEWLPVGIVDRDNVETVVHQTTEINNMNMQIRQMHSYVNKLASDYRISRGLSIILTVLFVILVTLVWSVVRSLHRSRKLRIELQKINRTTEKQARDLSESNEKLHILNTQIEEDFRQKLDYFTNICHEIRTPLTLIAAPVDQLLNAPPAGEAARRGLLETANKNIHLLLDLMTEILDFRKAQTGMMELHAAPFDLCAMLQEWAGSFKGVAQQQGVHIELDMPKEATFVIRADRKKMASIVINLVSNAVKHTPRDGHVTVALHTASLTADKATPDSFILTVADDGEGISPEVLPRIFEGFYQAPGTLGGTGIGLAFTKLLVELHGGTFDCQSMPGKGTTFTVRLPLQAAEAGAETTEYDVPQQLVDDEAPSELPTILVVDDNPEVCKYVESVLTPDYVVDTAENGQEGYEKALKMSPDLVILDVMMPVMDGLTCCRKLKQAVATSHVPVLLLTARTFTEHYIEGFDCGADAYIAKPFTVDLLRSRVKNLLKNRQLLKNIFGEAAQDKELNEPLAPREALFLADFKRFLEENYTNPNLRVPDIAPRLCVSYSQLVHKVKALTGKTPAGHLAILRLMKARELLETTNQSVTDVAYNVGFTSVSYFTRSFKEYFHTVPTSLR